MGTANWWFSNPGGYPQVTRDDETEFVDTRGRRRRKKKKEEEEPVREDSPATKERKYQQRVQKEAKTWIEIQMKRFTKDDED